MQRLVGSAKTHGAGGIVICIDEAQEIAPTALSTLKNALRRVDSVLVVLSLRLVTDQGGPKNAGRVLLDAIGNAAGGDIGSSRFFGTHFGMGPFATDEEARRCIRDGWKRTPSLSASTSSRTS